MLRRRKGRHVPAQSDARGELRGQNVLDATGRTPEDAAAKFKLSVGQVNASLARSRETLLSARANRPRPRRDEQGHHVLERPRHLRVRPRLRGARRPCLSRRRDEGRRVPPSKPVRSEDGPAHALVPPSGQCDRRVHGRLRVSDRGLFDLYEADFQPDHLRWAEALQKTQDTLFWDAKNGGYFNTAGTDPNLLLRSKTDDDGAEPSASSVAALNLARLGQALENDADTKRAASVLQAFDATLQRAPLAMPEMLVALDFQVGPTRQIVVAGTPDAADTAAMLQAARMPFLPDSIVLLADGGVSQEFLSSHVDFFKDLKPLSGKATVYVCENFTCHLPTSDLSEMRKLLATSPVVKKMGGH